MRISDNKKTEPHSQINGMRPGMILVNLSTESRLFLAAAPDQETNKGPNHQQETCCRLGNET